MATAALWISLLSGAAYIADSSAAQFVGREVARGAKAVAHKIHHPKRKDPHA